jgi:dTDP-4-amino-4,6-dideoxygalactose transaminase
MKVPWAEPFITEDEVQAVADVVRSRWISSGPKTREFEALVGSFIGVEHAVAVSNGTAALDVALAAVGVGPGDEVIVPAMTYIATINSVMYRHATPVFVDIDPDTYNMDPAAAKARITPATKAILSVGYGGHPQDYDALQAVADEAGLVMIDDAAQTLGAEYKGKRSGSLARVSTTSFHTAKIVTSVEGGMVFTDDAEIAEYVRIFRNQGEGPVKYVHPVIGHNYRMSDVHAVFGLTQFGRIDAVLEGRRNLAERYTKAFSSIDGIGCPYQAEYAKHAWFSYAIRIPNRDGVAAKLKEADIDTRVMYPMPVNKQPAYAAHANESYPVSEAFASDVLNLPIYYGMSEEQQDHVIERLVDAVKAS